MCDFSSVVCLCLSVVCLSFTVLQTRLQEIEEVAHNLEEALRKRGDSEPPPDLSSLRSLNRTYMAKMAEDSSSGPGEEGGPLSPTDAAHSEVVRSGKEGERLFLLPYKQKQHSYEYTFVQVYICMYTIIVGIVSQMYMHVHACMSHATCTSHDHHMQTHACIVFLHVTFIIYSLDTSGGTGVTRESGHT